MKIVKYQKCGKNTYKIYLEDGRVLLLYDNIILKYNLLLTKKIPKTVEESILLDNQKEEAYYKALLFLSKKYHSIQETKKYLATYSLNIQTEIIERLKKEGYLDDYKYANAFINDKINLSLDGFNKIKNALIEKGVAENIILPLLEAIPEKTWYERSQKAINKKASNYEKYSSKVKKSKFYSYLINLGYTSNQINSCLTKFDFSDDTKALEKDYLKVKKALAAKYSGPKFNYMLKSKLYAKGYSMESINKLIEQDNWDKSFNGNNKLIRLKLEDIKTKF